MSVQVIQILSVGSATSPAQIQAAGETYTAISSASTTYIGLAIGMESASLPAYWAWVTGAPSLGTFSSASNTTGLQAVNGQAYCVQNNTSVPVGFTINIGTPDVIATTVIPPGQAISFTFNSAATASSLIPVAVGSNCTSPAVPVPTSSKLKAWIEAHKTYAILIGIAAAIVIILILAGIGKLLS